MTAKPGSDLTRLNDADREAFTALLAGVYEHSPWVAASAWPARPFADLHDLHAALSRAVRGAEPAAQLALIRAHPELAARAAAPLTADSAREQRGAGLDNCAPAELQAFQRLNRDYRARFGFPFVIAVRGRTRQQIIAEAERRLQRTAAEEQDEALRQIDRIAWLRLVDRFGEA
ncbi:MAG TPA: 2-oxo-4-hydroxy-4-carboxy-5-ureidoimidazoline decarboxylase [Acetobacteraceae bacterium]|nr:2-oxo-4-hydroxy-4-carboxy-5-ureidoimidazoline decarboxylase [Acetobacteraceae bacterium]